MGTSESSMCIGICSSQGGANTDQNSLPEKAIKQTSKDAASLTAQASLVAQELKESQNTKQIDLNALQQQPEFDEEPDDLDNSKKTQVKKDVLKPISAAEPAGLPLEDPELLSRTPQKEKLVMDALPNLALVGDSPSVSALSQPSSAKKAQESSDFRDQSQDVDRFSVNDDDVKSLKSVSDGVPELDQDINVELKVDSTAKRESNDIEKVIDQINDVPQELDTIKNATEFQDGDDQTLLKDLESGTKEASGKYAHPSELTIIDCDSKENADEKTTLSADKNDSNSRVDSGGDPDCKIDLSNEIDDQEDNRLQQVVFKGKKRHLKKRNQKTEQVVLIKPFSRIDSDEEDSLSVSSYSNHGANNYNSSQSKIYKPKDSSSTYDRHNTVRNSLAQPQSFLEMPRPDPQQRRNQSQSNIPSDLQQPYKSSGQYRKRNAQYVKQNLDSSSQQSPNKTRNNNKGGSFVQPTSPLKESQQARKDPKYQSMIQTQNQEPVQPQDQQNYRQNNNNRSTTNNSNKRRSTQTSTAQVNGEQNAYRNNIGNYKNYDNKQTLSVQKYKTSLCRHFEITGTCSLSDACSFAHGDQEKRNPNDPMPENFPGKHYIGAVHSNYKTQVCRNFEQTGVCKFAENCCFAHGGDQLRNLTDPMPPIPREVLLYCPPKMKLLPQNGKIQVIPMMPVNQQDPQELDAAQYQMQQSLYMAHQEAMSMGNSDDSILMYGYDHNSHLNDGVYSQGVSSSAEDMEYNMIAPAMFPTYGMHQNNQMMYHHHHHQQPNQPFSNFTPPGVTQTANTPQQQQFQMQFDQTPNGNYYGQGQNQMAKQQEPAVNLPIKTPQDVSLNKQGISKAQGAVENATDSTTTDKQSV